MFFALEYLSGGDLMFHLQAAGKFSQPATAFYAGEICLALWFLHEHGVIFRSVRAAVALVCEPPEWVDGV